MEFDLKMRKLYLEYLIREGVLNDETAVEVLDRQNADTPAVGKLALRTGMMKMKMVFNTLSAQVDTGLRFGEQAVELGYIDREDLNRLLLIQNDMRPCIAQVLQDMGVADQQEAGRLRKKFLSTTYEVI